jgi:beta-galactosidase
MDMCGFPKNIYYYYQSWWTDQDILHISPHWNWKGREGKEIKVWVNSNADSVELLANGKSMGFKTMMRNRHLEWDIRYKPGKLEARAFKKGRQMVAEVETTGEPVALVLSSSKKILHGDGRDAVVVNVEAIDERGRKVPDAQNFVRFTIEGDARIIGVGNGDPSSHEPDKSFDGRWQRELFNGKCQVILQSGKKSGQVTLDASSNGLKSASIRYDVLPVEADD